MVDMTLNDLKTKVKVIHFGTNLFLIYNFLHAINSNFCFRTHRLATMHNVTDGDRRQTTGATLYSISATVSTVG